MQVSKNPTNLHCGTDKQNKPVQEFSNMMKVLWIFSSAQS